MHELALCPSIPVLALNALWWGIWRHHMPGGKFFQPAEPVTVALLLRKGVPP
jgi:hypothetical protein